MKTKLLIVVKTYPTLTTNYEESVCTAGITELGNWIRIYPVPFRKLSFDKQYRKYDWIEIDIVKNTSDFRPESYYPKNLVTDVKILESIGTGNNWQKRKELVLKNVYEDFKILIDESKDKSKYKSIAVFKPHKILDFHITEYENIEWDKDKLDRLNQLKLFENTIKPVDKIPYKFTYIFEDKNKKHHTLMIEDWEIGALYRNTLLRHKGDKILAIKDVIKKYKDEFISKKDLYFILGTTRVHHLVSKNPFIIIGVFYPPK
ncbi:MAG TPA: hypothetical protein VIL99_00850 [Ignavibacteria bacterium]